MKNSVRFLALLSAAAVSASTAAPAFAYVSSNNKVFFPILNEQPAPVAVREFAPRPVTSREVVRQREENRLLRDDVRAEATEDTTGRILLPVRSVWRQPGLRNRNRHILGQERGGEWRNAPYYLQGDVRLSSHGGVADDEEEGDDLPPSIVQTGGGTEYPTRRAVIRAHQDFNHETRQR